MSSPSSPRPVTVTVGRRGTLSPALAQVWERLWPHYGHRLQEDRSKPSDSLPALGSWFGREAPLAVDIGFGNGTATVSLAQQLPDHNILGVERYQPGLAQLLQQIEEYELPNIRLLRGDATDILLQLSLNSLSFVRILFPDPWPKTRHHKRRLVNLWTLSQITDRLRVGGVLHIATDDDHYAEAIADSLDDEPRLVAMHSARSVPSRPTTAFEARAQQAGRTVTEFVLCRENTDSSPEFGND